MFSEHSPANDLRIFFTFLMFFAFIMITIQSRRSELIGRYDFIWKLQVLRIVMLVAIASICRHWVRTLK